MALLQVAILSWTTGPSARFAGPHHRTLLPDLRSAAAACRSCQPKLLLEATTFLTAAADGAVALPAPITDAMTLPTSITESIKELDKEIAETAINALGNDILVFLAASVFVVPLSRYLNITPVLGFLALGCAIGPYGLGLFSNTEADVELGDFGILFLLFVEGLNLSPERIKKLGTFFSLGAAQLLLSIGVLFFGTLVGGPLLLPLLEQFVPLDDALIRPLLERPVEAFTIAAAGALSSSAFVLPVLKQKGWEQSPDGLAMLSILLLQDLAVAPLLVLLPIAAGSGPQTSGELGILVAKATFGFGGVLVLGSQVRQMACPAIPL